MLENIWFILLILLVVSLIACSMGFKKYVWFLSIGYGMAIAACGLAMIVIYLINGMMNITGLIASLLFIAYGLRLSLFLLIRELKNANYRARVASTVNIEKPMPMFVKVTMWLIVGILYVMEVSGVNFAIFNKETTGFFDVNLFEIIGLFVMVIAILIESIADKQKSAYKKINPKKAAMGGLYKFCRCPNYYGEILFWTGVALYAFATVTLNTWWEWLIIAIGYISIVYIMFNGAKRLEKRQEKSYGEDPEFQAYIAKTPILIFLFIPFKSLKNSKIVK